MTKKHIHTNTLEEEEIAKRWKENKNIINTWECMRPEAIQHFMASIVGNFKAILA